MDKVQTRPATLADVRALAVLHVETWQAAYRGLLPDALLDSMGVEARDQSWRRILAEGGNVCLAVRGPLLLGFSSYGDCRDEDASTHVGELFGLYVRPDAWNTGVGRRLHDVAMSALASAGSHEATLWVLDRNRRARQFYERQGWRADGIVKTDDRPGAILTEVRYRRFLTTGLMPGIGHDADHHLLGLGF